MGFSWLEMLLPLSWLSPSRAPERRIVQRYGRPHMTRANERKIDWHNNYLIPLSSHLPPSHLPGGQEVTKVKWSVWWRWWRQPLHREYQVILKVHALYTYHVAIMWQSCDFYIHVCIYMSDKQTEWYTDRQTDEQRVSYWGGGMEFPPPARISPSPRNL